ncbi:MAG: type II toxin-antitoxin system HicA family toxin [Candidatus Levybacteria bacterium]|nr:type II toxin-antitoxin system HicA family toxin [Candidatus Levybacteria bacterium]
MSRLYSGQKIIKALHRAGFNIVSTKGSHVKLRGIRFGKLQTVIVPKHKEVAFGTLQSILRQAAMEIEELKELIR